MQSELIEKNLPDGPGHIDGVLTTLLNHESNEYVVQAVVGDAGATHCLSLSLALPLACMHVDTTFFTV
jgi:hypothetical protein